MSDAMSDSTPPYQAYILCTAPRSGSTLLCSLLRASGVAGNPASYFHEASLAEWLDDLGIAVSPSTPERTRIALAFAAAQSQGKAGGDLFGLRLQAHSLPFFLRQLACLHPQQATDTARLTRAFGRIRFLYLHRADKLDQAVSFLKARQSGLWHRAADGSELERLAPHQDPHYDRAAIDATIATLQGYDRTWEDWFTAQGITPLRLSYDRLSADPRTTLRAILAELGRDPAAADRATPGVRKLADATSRDWVARYRAGD